MLNQEKFNKGKELYLKLLSENKPGFVSFDKEVLSLRIKKITRYLEQGTGDKSTLRSSLNDLVNLRYYLEMENDG